MHRDLTFRVAIASDHPRIAAAYEAWGYHGSLSTTDIVYLAEIGAEIVAVIRRTNEHGITLLRGMYVAREQQRKGIGRRLLAFFVRHLGSTECYCVPYTYLQAFYAQAGFALLDPESVPSFLAERMAVYRARGLDVFVMRRPAFNTTTQPTQNCIR